MWFSVNKCKCDAHKRARGRGVFVPQGDCTQQQWVSSPLCLHLNRYRVKDAHVGPPGSGGRKGYGSKGCHHFQFPPMPDPPNITPFIPLPTSPLAMGILASCWQCRSTVHPFAWCWGQHLLFLFSEICQRVLRHVYDTGSTGILPVMKALGLSPKLLYVWAKITFSSFSHNPRTKNHLIKLIGRNFRKDKLVHISHN